MGQANGNLKTTVHARCWVHLKHLWRLVGQAIGNWATAKRKSRIYWDCRRLWPLYRRRLRLICTEFDVHCFNQLTSRLVPQLHDSDQGSLFADNLMLQAQLFLFERNLAFHLVENGQFNQAFSGGPLDNIEVLSGEFQVELLASLRVERLELESYIFQLVGRHDFHVRDQRVSLVVVVGAQFTIETHLRVNEHGLHGGTKCSHNFAVQRVRFVLSNGMRTSARLCNLPDQVRVAIPDAEAHHSNLIAV